ncbi:glycosyltransferase [Phaeobacter sp. CAU 1743]|uniref:glycosyltransferase n=1 Tax=Phaeobacter sp. CAU 1743 TaxID=3140367 RepID=UPI00325B5F3E
MSIADEIKASGLFDRDWYLATYRDVALSGIPPIAHFVRIGMKIGRNPGPKFDTRHYLSQVSSGDLEGMAPVMHFIRVGRAQGFAPIAVKQKTVGSPQVAKEPVANIARPAGAAKEVPSWVNPSVTFSQILRALEISKHPDAVAITCWDGGHNPIGRAKVLYDICKTGRKPVLFTYHFQEFSDVIWEPIADEDITVVQIPWAERAKFLKMIADCGIEFPTVWICKSRYPSFELAAHITGAETRVILDDDDNEEHFSRSKASTEKFYGRFSTSLTRYVASNLASRSAASVTLARKTGADIVRHCRRAVPEELASRTRTPGPQRIGFIGTVRPHKGVIEAARAIRDYREQRHRDVEFHVYGDFNPPTLKDELRALGVTVRDNIPSSELFETLQGFDVILTGYDAGGTDPEVTRYQISSKIGDGLAAGKPVLTPYYESVADLEDIEGLFLFTQDSFFGALDRALGHMSGVSLPEQFTYEYGFAVFEALEARADTGRSLDMLMQLRLDSDPLTAGTEPKNLVLVWKQQDAGLYGRRVDQLARSFRLRHPDTRVIILEIASQGTFDDYQKSSSSFVRDHALQLQDVPQKELRKKSPAGGVELHLIRSRSRAMVEKDLSTYMIDEGFYPGNTLLVLFPLHQLWEKCKAVFSAYQTIVDVVDNQLSWASNDAKREAYVSQYLDAISGGTELVFNSPVNMEFFRESGLLSGWLATGGTPRVIPNWYHQPPLPAAQMGAGTASRFGDRDGKTHLLYSGNMSDRFDWELIDSLARTDDYVIHLVGSAARQADRLQEVLENDQVVYWGILPETRLARLIGQVDIGIVPHTLTEVSKYMNPLKVEMYVSYGLPVVCTEIPGLAGHDGVHVCGSHEDFKSALERLAAHAGDPRQPHIPAAAVECERQYLELIEQCLRSLRRAADAG